MSTQEAEVQIIQGRLCADLEMRLTDECSQWVLCEAEHPDSSRASTHAISDGDILTVFTSNTTKKVLWSGIVKLYRCHPSEYTLDYESAVGRNTWAQWFSDKRYASLTKCHT